MKNMCAENKYHRSGKIFLDENEQGENVQAFMYSKKVYEGLFIPLAKLQGT
jgi:hypothetical protein